MTNLREAVARAIMLARLKHPRCEVVDWDAEARDNPHVEQAVNQATAAVAAVLDAMAEPSAGAIDAGRDVIMSDRMPGAGGRLPKAAVAVSVWSAMLAAFREDALQDVEGRK